MASSRSSSGARRRASKQLRSTTAHFQIARQSSAHRRTASEAARAQFASTLEPLRLRTLRPPALKIDRPSKYRILAYVSKLASQLLQRAGTPSPERAKSPFPSFPRCAFARPDLEPGFGVQELHFSTLSMLAFWAPPTPSRKPRKSWKWWKRPAGHIGVAVFCRPSVRSSVGTSGRGSGAMIPLAGELRAYNSGGRSSEWRWCLTVQGSIGGSSVTASHR